MPEEGISLLEHEVALRRNIALKKALDHEVRRRCGFQSYVARLERERDEKKYIQTIFLDRSQVD